MKLFDADGRYKGKLLFRRNEILLVLADGETVRFDRTWDAGDKIDQYLGGGIYVVKDEA